VWKSQVIGYATITATFSFHLTGFPQFMQIRLGTLWRRKPDICSRFF